MAKYIHGVGDSNNPLVKVLGGAFGVGVVDRIVRGYTFLSRHYAEGDAIHIVGFSRGAYTARALAGMIATVGLLNPRAYDPADRRRAYRLGVAAWCRAKRTTFSAGRLSGVGNAFLTLLENVVATALPPNGLIPNVPIESVAVWDTVGSLGIPKYADGERMDILRFTDETLSDKVRHGFHAMAIDERRFDFPVTKWNPHPRIEQVWFVGAHCDVGGGYVRDQSYLSDIALGWMLKKLGGLGIKCAVPLPYLPKPRALGGQFHTPWSDPPFKWGLEAARQVATGDTLHVTVRERWDGDLDPPYRPASMSGFGPQIAGASFDKTPFP